MDQATPSPPAVPSLSEATDAECAEPLDAAALVEPEEVDVPNNDLGDLHVPSPVVPGETVPVTVVNPTDEEYGMLYIAYVGTVGSPVLATGFGSPGRAAEVSGPAGTVQIALTTFPIEAAATTEVELYVPPQLTGGSHRVVVNVLTEEDSGFLDGILSVPC